MTGLLAPFLADAADEGRNIVLSMLVVGLVIVGVAVLGDVGAWLRHRSRRH